MGFNYPDVKSPGTWLGSGASAALNLRTNFILPPQPFSWKSQLTLEPGKARAYFFCEVARHTLPAGGLVSSMASDPQISHLSAHS